MVASGAGKRCAHCGASDTPLWRVGPSGPKTLCNACGLRWRKTGRLDDDGGEHASHARTHAHGIHKSSPSSKKASHGARKGTMTAKAQAAAQRRSERERERAYSPASFVSDDDDGDGDADVQLLNVEQYGRAGRRNASPVHCWPPAVEEFRRSAVRKSERSYTVDDFWPLYRNVFSGLMVVHKTPR